MLLLILLLVLIFGIPSVGWGYNEGAYRGPSIGVGLLVLLLLVWLVMGHRITL